MTAAAGSPASRSIRASPAGAGSPRRFAALDGLRGVAALLVVLFHIGWPTHFAGALFVRNSYLAVDLFFMLSGVVIYYNYSARIRNIGEARRFIRLRFFRVYPLHLAMLLILIALEAAKALAQRQFGTAPIYPPFTGASTATAIVPNILLLQGLPVMDRLTWNVPSWTISCEFFAYLLFAAVILSRIAQTRLFLPVLGVGSLLVYGVLAAIWGTLDLTYNWGFLRCIAGFSLGMLILHLAKDFRSEDWRSWIARGEVAAAALIVVVLAAVSGAWIALSIPLFLVLIALLQFEAGPVSRFLMSRPVQFAGRVSYSIYMVQFFIILCCSIAAKRLLHVPVVIDPHTQKPTFDIDPWAGDLLALMVIALVLATAAMTYRFIEEPARLFGRRLG